MAQLLIIEDEPLLARSIGEVMSDAGHDVQTALTGEEGLQAVRTTPPDLVLLDLRLPCMDGMDVLREMRAEQPAVAVVILTAHGSIDVAVEAVKLGAEEFLTKPVDLDVLVLIVERVLERQRNSQNLHYLKRRDRANSGVDAIIGESPAMNAMRAQVHRLVASPALRGEHPPTVLITGETGSGKDLLARAIHYEGPRADNSFVHVNCTAVPDELFESELFGHVRGAFTGAGQTRKGLMEVAEGGTIFLDEIGHLKPSLQAKLLTAIEHKKIRPVGASIENKINVHIISATNRDLEEAIGAGDFRDDLYHRLRVVPFHLPPLREHIDDVEPLALHFVTLYAARTGMEVTGIDEAAMTQLKAYDWPGNVRELAHALESAVLMCDDKVIRPQHLHVQQRSGGAPVEVAVAGGKSISVDFARGGAVLDDLEHDVLEAALEYAGHNISRAARVLGITREAVRYRLEKHRARRSESQRDAGA